MMLVKILLIFANIIIVCAAGIGCFVGFHDKKVSYLFAMSCFCCIIALIMITSLDKGTQPFVVCDG